MEVLKRKGFVFTPKGWKLPEELHIKRLLDDRVEEIFGSNVHSYRIVGSFGTPKFREESDIDIEIRVWEVPRASIKLSETEEKEPKLLVLDGHKLHFLIRPKEEP